MVNDRSNICKHTGIIRGQIRIKGVNKTFHDVNGNEIIALEKIDLVVRAGEFISFIGPSGCGKSTLLRLLAGLDTPTAGELSLDDKLIIDPGHERGLVFQDPTLFPWLNVHDNIASGLKARKVYKQQKQEVSKYIKLVGLEGFEKSYPHQISGGMAQRVALARALVNDPKVLLLDEPLGALDAFTRMQMQDELLRIWENKGTTMLMVTHDIDEAIFLCDRIVIMTSRPGKIQGIIEVKMERPRPRNHPDFLHMRSRILEILHYAKEMTVMDSLTKW
jgi:ABC-type nitrate/sulfonate/bicarbonate transport system ATPase subunit